MSGIDEWKSLKVEGEKMQAIFLVFNQNTKHLML